MGVQGRGFQELVGGEKIKFIASKANLKKIKSEQVK